VVSLRENFLALLDAIRIQLESGATLATLFPDDEGTTRDDRAVLQTSSSSSSSSQQRRRRLSSDSNNLSQGLKAEDEEEEKEVSSLSDSVRFVRSVHLFEEVSSTTTVKNKVSLGVLDFPTQFI
jgi:hypothetical protein